jgi:hypothetical protein
MVQMGTVIPAALRATTWAAPAATTSTGLTWSNVAAT